MLLSCRRLALPRSGARLLLAAVAAVAFVGISATPASAHALLVSTTPADGASVAAAPTEVVLEFDEHVQTPTAGVRVYDTAGNRVDDGSVSQTSPSTVAVDLPADDLGDGAYIVTWRAISGDGHPISGAFVFSVGAVGTVPDAVLAGVVAAGDAPVAAAVARVVRGLSYAGTLLAAGAVAFVLWVAGGDRDARRRAVRWSRRGAVLAAFATVVMVPLQSLVTTGLGVAGSLAPSVLGDVVATPFGVGSVARLLACGLLLLTLTETGRRSMALPAAAAAAALASFLFDGHTVTREPAWVMIPGDAVHLLAGAAWFGGLVVLAAVLRARRLEDDPLGAATLVARFSGLATVAMIAVSLAGLALAWVLVQVPRALTSTTYGWTLLVKVALVAVVILTGAFNKRRLVPLVTASARRVAGGATDVLPGEVAGDRILQASAAAWATLRRTVRFEVAGLVAVLMVTGFLVNQRPAADAAGVTGAYATSAVLTDTLTVELVVDPNRAGTNQLHLYVLDDTGRPAQDITDVRLLFTQTELDIGPIERVPQLAAAGHWIHAGNELSLPGPWTIEVVAGIDRFTEASASIPVVVNPSRDGPGR